MKAVRAGHGEVAVVDVEEPPGSGELLDITATSVCASDLGYVAMGFDQVLGHELAGFREDGTAVVVEALCGCGSCDQCRRGRYNLCPTHPQRALGVSVDGGMAEQFRAPPERLVPLPAGLDVRDACLVEPATVSWHALRLAGTGPGQRVAVVGGGALGLLAVAGARRMGAAVVALDARYPHQREAGERLGAPTGATGEYDVVVEAAGTTAHREARVIPSLGYCGHDGGREMEDAAAMVADDPEIARALITHRFPIEDAAEAFRVAGDRSSGAIRVVIEP